MFAYVIANGALYLNDFLKSSLMFLENSGKVNDSKSTRLYFGTARCSDVTQCTT